MEINNTQENIQNDEVEVEVEVEPKQKKELSQKQLEHLNNIRVKALEEKKLNYKK